MRKSRTPRSRIFAAHVGKKCRHCFGSGEGGTALDLYLAVTKLPIHEAAQELCTKLHVEVPRLPRRATHSPPS